MNQEKKAYPWGLLVVSGVLALSAFALALVPAMTFPLAVVSALAFAWFMAPPTGALADPARQMAVLIALTAIAAIVSLWWTRAWS